MSTSATRPQDRDKKAVYDLPSQQSYVDRSLLVDLPAKQSEREGKARGSEKRNAGSLAVGGELEQGARTKKEGKRRLRYVQQYSPLQIKKAFSSGP